MTSLASSAVRGTIPSVVVTATAMGNPTQVAPLSSRTVNAVQSAISQSSSSRTASRQSPTPNILEIDLHTIVIIPDFSLYYSGNISNFRPSYHALADGSLVADPLISDIRSANIQLASTSALAAFFFLTSWIAAQYIRRGKVKRKVLFYELLLSQLFGLGAMVIMIVPFFDQFVSCVAAEASVLVIAASSYALLMTGILGLKAYRVLDNSKLIPIVLGAFRIAITTLLFLYLAKTHFTRRLSGGCLPAFGQGSMSTIILLHAAEAAFISSCFLVAVWRTSRSSVVRGRLSISASVRDPHDYRSLEEYKEEPDHPRGWWDYVPPQVPEARMDARSLKTTDTHGPARPERKHSIVSAHFASHSAYPTVGRFRDQPPLPPLPDAVRKQRRTDSPPPPSVGSRLSRYMPRMQVFREVVKNELTYCTLVTVILLVISLLSKIGAPHPVFKNSAAWVSIPWLLLSLCTLGSFGEVVRRHERDAILQHPAAWDPVYRAELEASRAFSGRNGRSYSPVSVCSRVPPRAPLFTNPFADVRSVPSIADASRTSSTRRPRAPRTRSTSSSSRELINPRQLNRSPSQTSSASGTSSISLASSVGSVLLPPEPLFRRSAPESIHPSPTSGHFPALGSFSSACSDTSEPETHNPVHPSAAPLFLEPSTDAFGGGSTASLLPRHSWHSQNPFEDGQLRSS